MNQPLLRMTGISKSFPGVRALRSVDFSVGAGEVHALLGENGAGKSTLLKILSGAQRQNGGTIEYAGESVEIGSPQRAQSLGIATIYQEFTLIPDMSIAENVLIGREPGRAGFVNWRRMLKQAGDAARGIGLDRHPATPVRDLSVAEQQLVEIARALSTNSRLIIMDEPTAALSAPEVEKLFDIVRRLKAQGLSIVLVTHRLEEAKAICDRFTVLRDGQDVAAGDIADVSIADVIRHMVGREVVAAPRQPSVIERTATPMLEVRGLSRARNTRDTASIELRDVSLRAHAGEVLGIAGLVGSGRTEIVRAIFGADRIDGGDILVDGRPTRMTSPLDAIRAGIGLVPEDRKNQALFLALSVRENLSITAQSQILRMRCFVDEAAERDMVEHYRDKLRIRMSGPGQTVANLSGGNQQKVILARWLAMRPKVLIVDEPTRGIDIGAKAEVHQLLFELAASGIAVVVISSELPEVMAVSDRIVTVRQGRVTGELPAAEATPERLMAMMTLSPEAA